MSDDISRVVQNVEQSRTSRDGHTHNFEQTYASIAQLQNHDAATPGKFNQDLATVNQRLHSEGLLPNLNIVGIDQANHRLITQDIADHRTVSQNPSAVNDFGALGSGGNGREAAAGMMARMLGVEVTRNPQGGYDVTDPLDDPNAAGKILQTVLSGLMGGSPRSNSGYYGMNPLMAAAWRGWPPETPSNE